MKAVRLLNERQHGSLLRSRFFDKSNSFTVGTACLPKNLWNHEGVLNSGVYRCRFTFLPYGSGSFIKLSSVLIKFTRTTRKECVAVNICFCLCLATSIC